LITRGEHALFNLEIKKKRRLSIDLDIHHPKVFISGKVYKGTVMNLPLPYLHGVSQKHVLPSLIFILLLFEGVCSGSNIRELVFI